MTRTFSALALVLALLLAACGGDDDATAASDTDATTETEAAESTDDDGATTTTEEATTTTAEETTTESTEAETSTTAAETTAPTETDDDSTPGGGSAQAGALSIVSIDFETAMVEIVNTSDAPIDLDTHILCNFPSYAPIEGAGMIGPGETATIMSTVAIPADDGELGIYATGDFANPGDIVAYVEWGSAGHTRAEVAVAAGIWDGAALTPDGTVLVVAP